MPTPTPVAVGFNATTEETGLASHILSRPECSASGSLNGPAALDIMGRSNLDMRVLRDIWTIADEDRSGDLALEELTRALRLIGWAQAGEKPHRALLETVGPLAHLEGIVVPTLAPAPDPPVPTPTPPLPDPSRSPTRRPPPPRRAIPSAPASSSTQPPPPTPSSSSSSPSPALHQPPSTPPPATQYPPVEPEDTRRYYAVFTQADARHGILDGDSALDVYMAFSLPYSAIHAVRKLVTRSERNELQFCEFALGMYLLEGLQSRRIKAVPSSIPQHILDQLSDPSLTEDQSPPAPPPPLPPHPPLREREIHSEESQDHARSRSDSRSNLANYGPPRTASPSPQIPPRPPTSHRMSRIVQPQPLPHSHSLSQQPQTPVVSPKHSNQRRQQALVGLELSASTSANSSTPSPNANYVDEGGLNAATSVSDDRQDATDDDDETTLVEWDVLPHEKLDYDRQFLKLDLERTGFIDNETFSRFMVNYNVPSFELAQICELADMEHDSRIDNDEFSVAMHLVKKRLAGEAIPRKLPLSLIPPSMRKKMRQRSNTTSTLPSAPQSPSVSPLVPRKSLKASGSKPKPPPKPEIHRRSMSHTQGPSGGTSVAHMAAAIAALSAAPSGRFPRPGSSSGSSANSSSPATSPRINHRASVAAFPHHPISISASNSSEDDIMESPFEDPEATISTHHLSPMHPPIVNRASRPITPTPNGMALNTQLHVPHASPASAISDSSYVMTPTAISGSTLNNDAMMDQFKRETSQLTEQVQSLLAQLTAQNELRTSNDELKAQNERLRAQVREMERTVSEVLSASERNQHLAEEVARLAEEVVSKDAQIETTERMLAVVTQEDEQRREAYKELELAMLKARKDAEESRDLAESRKREVDDLTTRLADMGKALANEGDPSMSNNRQLRVLFSDVSRENESLKTKVRDMERSMEQLLLTSKSHAKQDELERENRRLKRNVQELEIIATQLQVSSSKVNGKTLETLAKENEQMQKEVKETKRAFTEYRTTSDAKLQEMREKVQELTRENARLKVDIHHASSSGRPEDPSMPPPAYDDSFVATR